MRRRRGFSTCARLIAPLSLWPLLACGSNNSSPASAASAGPPQPQCDIDGGDWPMYGQNICNTHALSSDAITTANVGKLTKKWAFTAAGPISATPAVIDGRVYVPDFGGMMNCLDAATGTLLWKASVAEIVTGSDAGSSAGGYASRSTPVIVGNSLIFGTMRQVPQILEPPYTPGAFLVALDKNTGALEWKLPLHEGHPAAIITGSPVVYDGTAYIGVSSLEEVFAGLVSGYTCCSFRGSVAAVNAANGTLLWQTHTISDAVYFAQPSGISSGDAGASTGLTSPDGGALSGYAGNAVWSSTPVVDIKRNQLYITTGQNYLVPPGAPDVVDGNGVDAIMALNLATGAVNWSHSFTDWDIWTFGSMSGADADFGSGANLFSAVVKGPIGSTVAFTDAGTATPGGPADGGTEPDGGVLMDLVGAGQKNGVYWALNPDNGQVVWSTIVGPGGHLGGIHWGTATDGLRIYVGVNNETNTPFVLGGSGPQGGTMTTSGAWAALDPGTGHILWQIANPALTKSVDGANVNGPVTVVNGVVFVGSMDTKGTMFALDAATGKVLWQFVSGATVYGGPAIVDGVVYWGSGYPSARLQFGTTGQYSLYAFQVAN